MFLPKIKFYHQTYFYNLEAFKFNSLKHQKTKGLGTYGQRYREITPLFSVANFKQEF
jgi:hypothetical protein